MPSAIFVVSIQEGSPVLPPMSNPDDGSIYLNHGEGSGYSCIGHVPEAPTCLVRVWSDQATIEAMALDPAYLFVEQVD